MPEVANTQVGLTTVQVSELLEKNTTIAALRSLVSSKESEIAVLESRIADLKSESRVLVVEKRGWDEKVVGHRNLDDVKIDIRKIEEAKVQEELTKLRSEVATFQAHINQLEKTHESELDIERKEHELEVEKLRSRQASKIDELTKKLEEVADIKDKTVAELGETIEELKATITKTSDKEARDKELNAINKTVSSLTEELEKMRSKNIFIKIKNYFTNSYDRILDQISDLRYDLRSEIADIRERKYNLPSTFNKYATWKVVDEDKDYWSGRVIVKLERV